MKLGKIINKILKKAKIPVVTTLVVGSLVTGMVYAVNYEHRLDEEIGPNFKIARKGISYDINGVWKAGKRNIYIIEHASGELLLTYHLCNTIYDPDIKTPKLIFKSETMHRDIFSKEYRPLNGTKTYELRLPKNFEIKDGSNFHTAPPKVYWKFKNLLLF